MACFDLQLRQLPSGNGDRILLWLVTPRRPPLVVFPYPECVNGWYGLRRVDDRFWYKPGARGLGLRS